MDYSIITLHGYLESNFSMQYFNTFLKNQNFNIVNPNLIGHGTKYKDLKKVKYQHWIEQVEKIYKDQTGKTIIIGQSLGGTLALYIAEKYKPAAIILINHLYDCFPISLLSTPIGKHFVSFVPNLKPDIKKKGPVFLYNKVSSHNSHEIIKLCKIVKKQIKNVHCPLLLFKSKKDHRVKISNSLNTYNMVSSRIKKMIYLNNSYHIASLDHDRNFILTAIIKFIKKVENGCN